MAAAPAFHDAGLKAGRRYEYAVTAVDRDGNESGKSAAAAVLAPAE